MIQIHWTMLIVITALEHFYEQRKNGWTDVDAVNFSYKLKLIRNKSISVSRSVRHELFIVSVSNNRFEFMIIAIKVILSVCFYLNLSQNRIESPNPFSSFKLVFLLLATFSHPSVNPGVQSNLGFPGKGGVGGCHGTILFLTCLGFSSPRPAACTTGVFGGCFGGFWWASAPKPAFLPVTSVGALEFCRL